MKKCTLLFTCASLLSLELAARGYALTGVDIARELIEEGQRSASLYLLATTP